jgi:hypothetical protein
MKITSENRLVTAYHCRHHAFVHVRPRPKSFAAAACRRRRRAPSHSKIKREEREKRKRTKEWLQVRTEIEALRPLRRDKGRFLHLSS